MGKCRGWTVAILLVLSAQVFLTTCVKNPYLLRYFDAVEILSKVDEYSTSISESISYLSKSTSQSTRADDNGEPNTDGGVVEIAVSERGRSNTTTTGLRTKESNGKKKNSGGGTRKKNSERKKKANGGTNSSASTPGLHGNNDDKIVVSKLGKPKDGVEKEPRPTKAKTGTATKKKVADKKPNKQTAKTKTKRQRIVIMAGPHKTASTTLQKFFSDLAHQSIKLLKKSKRHMNESLMPHPSNPDWVFPIGISEEYTDRRRETMLTGSPLKSGFHDEKFYAILASFISARRLNMYFPEWHFDDKNDEGIERIATFRKKTMEYFRALMRRPWDEGKSLVIAAEAFDTLVESLAFQAEEGRQGEELHVADDSGYAIDALLDIFPWDANGEDSLTLDDFEIHMNLRTPRVSHLISVWHQLGRKTTLREFLYKFHASNLYQINTLSLALQFVRRGIKVTILDMSGVKEKEAREAALESKETTNTTVSEAVVGGLQGIVGCEILRMDNVCDETSKMHLKGFQIPKNQNVVKTEKHERNLNEKQLEEIGKVLDAYDCGVWQHLVKYQEKGTLRILYPSEHLFETCRPGKDRDISFIDALVMIREIAIQDNGIPLESVPKKSKMQLLARKENNIRKRMIYLSNPPK